MSAPSHAVVKCSRSSADRLRRLEYVMSDSFNPYVEWLRCKATGSRPNYYELLQLGRTEADLDRIAKAATAQLVKLRAVRPGPKLPRWRELMEEIETAKRVLSSPDERRRYDAGPGRVDASMEYQPERASDGGDAAGQNPLPPGMTKSAASRDKAAP